MSSIFDYAADAFDGGQVIPRKYYDGLSLRDLLAIVVLINGHRVSADRATVSIDEISERCYLMADAMLKARMKAKVTGETK